MPLVPLRVILDHAAENDYGVAAFNVNNMEQILDALTRGLDLDIDRYGWCTRPDHHKNRISETVLPCSNSIVER